MSVILNAKIQIQQSSRLVLDLFIEAEISYLF